MYGKASRLKLNMCYSRYKFKIVNTGTSSFIYYLKFMKYGSSKAPPTGIYWMARECSKYIFQIVVNHNSYISINISTEAHVLTEAHPSFLTIFFFYCK